MSTQTARTAPSADQLVGARIHQLLFLRRMTQTGFAQRLGMSQTNVSKKLRGVVGWSAGELVQAAGVLETSVAYLFGETEDPRRPGPDGGHLKGWLPDLDSNQEPAANTPAARFQPRLVTAERRIRPVVVLPRHHAA